jgi:hypothetical protein
MGLGILNLLSCRVVKAMYPNQSSSKTFPQIHPKECDSGYSRGTCTPMFTAALSTIAKLWKQPRCPTTDEWIKKMWYLYTMEFYSAMKKNEILSFASKWMELENIILSEVSLAQKTKNRMFSLIFGHEIKGKHSKGIGL